MRRSSVNYEPKHLIGNLIKCHGCNGRGYTESENHPNCPLCSGNGYLKESDEKNEREN